MDITPFGWLMALKFSGVKVTVEEGRLKLTPSSRIPREWIPGLQAAREDLLAYLQQGESVTACATPYQNPMESTSPERWVAALKLMGVQVFTDGVRLGFNPMHRVPSEWMPYILEAKPKIIAYLSSKTT